MNFFDQRVIFSDNGTLYDITDQVNDWYSSSYTLPIVAAQDALYIGTLFPWSARYIEIDTANTATSTLSAEIYTTANAWESVVDLYDQTSSGGKSLAGNGYIRFQVDRDSVFWNPLRESNEAAALTGTYIYDLYWLRLKWNNDLFSSTSIKFIGHKFADDEDMYVYYPDLNQSALKTAFRTGKTTWNDQHYSAAKIIVSELKQKKALVSLDQIADPYAFQEAGVHKAAELIYRGLGEAYVPKQKAALDAYKEQMNFAFKNIDTSKDGNISTGERMMSYGRLHR
jgi:hypothetical protein